MNTKWIPTASLEVNKTALEAMFSEDKTIKYRTVINRSDPHVRGLIVFVDGMCDSLYINDHVITPFVEADALHRTPDTVDKLCTEILLYSELKTGRRGSDLLNDLMSGDCLLIVDGYSQVITVGVKSWHTRSVEEPESEKVLTGPREGFNEAILTSLSLLRRKVRNPALKYEFLELGRQTRTRACIAWLDGVADRQVVEEMRTRLESIDIDGILDSNYVQELIRDSRLSPFRSCGSTERPDVAAARILEGRCALIIDGTPAVLTVPYFFLEAFQAGDDYYSHYYFGSFSRLLRITGFFVSIGLPGLYTALVTFHQDLLPTRFLLNLASLRSSLPFPTFFEMLLLVLAFELIRESGSRIPSGFGQTLSVVGGLVLGQSAVDAYLVSVPAVIIVAFAGVTGLTVPQLKTPVLVFRLLLLVLAGILGLPGFLLGIGCLLAHLSGLETFGFAYTSLLNRNSSQKYKDVLLRAPWNLMTLRPSGIAPENGRRQPYRHQCGPR